MQEFKICSSCKKQKDISFFGIKNRKTKNGIKIYFNIYCKTCVCLKSKISRDKHPDTVKRNNNNEKSKLRRLNWLLKNKDKRKEYEKKYYLNNILKFKKISNTSSFKLKKIIYKKKRMSNDPIFRLRQNISNRVYKALNGKTSKAGKSIFKYLNYNILDLKNHLEKLFDDKMSWLNYGNYWHIDHIIPHSEFNYLSLEDDNFKKCWQLNNLRPLEAKQNIIDGARRTRHNS